MSDSVRYSVAGSVATITLNRPQVMNALDAAMIRRLREVAEQVEREAAVRVVVLQGEGASFCAGGNVETFRANLATVPTMVREVAGDLHHAILALRRSPRPVLASVHGAVAGAGMSLMTAADLAIAADDTKFTLAYSRIGTSPDGGATWSLPRLVGHRRALELMLLSDTFDAQAAFRLGLVNWIVDAGRLAAETDSIARRLAQGATAAFGEIKRLVYQGADQSLEAQLDAEIEAFARCAGTRDFAEGVAAFLEKRKPLFKGE